MHMLYLYLVPANWQWLSTVEILASVKDWFLSTEVLTVYLYKCLNDLSVHSPRAFLGYYRYVIVIEYTGGDFDLWGPQEGMWPI